jgi:hypothetical protein
VHALATPAYAIALVLVYREGSWYGRYLLSALAISLPLVAGAYRNRRVAAVFAVVGVTTLVLVHAYNTNKPTGLARTAVWKLDRAGAQSVGLPGFDRVIDAVDGVSVDDEPVGIVMGEQDWDYPFYGPLLRRAVVALPHKGVLDAAQRRGLRIVVFGRNIPPPEPAPGWRTLRFSWQGTVLVAER